MSEEARNSLPSRPSEAVSSRPEFRPEAAPARVLDFVDAMRRVEDEVYNVA